MENINLEISHDEKKENYNNLENNIIITTEVNRDDKDTIDVKINNELITLENNDNLIIINDNETTYEIKNKKLEEHNNNDNNDNNDIKNVDNENNKNEEELIKNKKKNSNSNKVTSNLENSNNLSNSNNNNTISTTTENSIKVDSSNESKKKPISKTKENTSNNKSNLQTRTRARTTAFEPKKLDKQTNKIIATGIGENNFKSLVSMFDKTKQLNVENKDDDKRNSNINIGNKINTSIFEKKNLENQENSNKKNSAFVSTSGLSIKERLEMLKKEAELAANKGKKAIDPVLESMKEGVDENDELEYNEEQENNDDDNLALSDNEDNSLGIDDNEDNLEGDSAEKEKQEV